MQPCSVSTKIDVTPTAKKRLNMRALAVIAGLLVGGSPAIAASSYVLVSSDETTPAAGAQPCMVYRLDDGGGIEPLYEFAPNGGIFLVVAEPSWRRVVVWGYEIHGPNPIAVIDIDEPAKSKVFAFEEVGAMGGHIIRFDDGQYRIVMNGPQADDFVPLVLDPATGALVRARREDIPYERAHVRGGCGMQGRSHHLMLFYDVEEGAFYPRTGNHVSSSPLPFKLPEEYRAMAVEANQMIGVNCAGNDGSVFRVILSKALSDAEFGGLITQAIFDKRRGDWRRVGFDEQGRLLVFMNVDPWLISRPLPEPRSRRADPESWKGEFVLHDTISGRVLEWSTGPATVILGIWDDTILYRRRNAIYEATISEKGVEGEKKLHEGPEMAHVHWAFQARALNSAASSVHVPRRNDGETGPFFPR